jgi:hypothetical protein
LDNSTNTTTKPTKLAEKFFGSTHVQIFTEKISSRYGAASAFTVLFAALYVMKDYPIEQVESLPTVALT